MSSNEGFKMKYSVVVTTLLLMFSLFDPLNASAKFLDRVFKISELNVLQEGAIFSPGDTFYIPSESLENRIDVICTIKRNGKLYKCVFESKVPVDKSGRLALMKYVNSIVVGPVSKDGELTYRKKIKLSLDISINNG
jgi:hypothetical protein